jgi:GWxTD domain-containing protein
MKTTALFLILLLAASAVAGAVEYEIAEDDLRPLGPEMRRQIAGLQYLLNPYQLRQFFSLPSDGARAEWIARYWRAQDPTPTTEENERLIEHTIRVRLARQFFPWDRWPGWDQRGEVYIRYGPPNYRGIMHAEVTQRKVHPPGELWYYTRHDMVVSFQDFNLNGRYIYSINPLGALQDLDPELVEFFAFAADEPLQQNIPQNLLEDYRAPELDREVAEMPWGAIENALIGPRPRRVTRQRMDRVVEGMDEIGNPDQPELIPDNPSTQFLMRRAEDMAANFEGVLEDTPASYPFNFEREQRLPFFFGVGQYKAGSSVNRVEVNVQFPVDPAREDEDGDARSYVASAVFMDEDYQELTRDDRELVLPVQGGAGAATRYMPAQLVGSLRPGYYRLAVSVRELGTERESAYWTTVDRVEYGGDLVVSDVLFAQKIASAERQSPFNRGALEVVPHPLRRYRQGTPIPIYFEVYNLGLDEGGLSNYEVEYRIVPHTGRKTRFWDRFTGETPVASSRFRSSGYSTDEPLYVTIESENLEPGTYDFLVTIKDEYWQSVTYKRATFRIVE